MNVQLTGIEQLTKFIKGLNVKKQVISLVSTQGNAVLNNKKSCLNGRDLDNLINKLNKKYQNNQDMRINCGAGYKSIRIKPDLTITPCPLIDKSLGNLNKNSIEELMSINSNSFCNTKMPNKEYCEGCKFEFNCNRCVAEGLINRKYVKECKWFQAQDNSFKDFYKDN